MHIHLSFLSVHTQHTGKAHVQKVMMEMLYFDVDPDECRELPEIMKPDEVAEFLCIHKNTVYKMIKRGDLPALRVGRSWRVPRRSLATLAYDG